MLVFRHLRGNLYISRSSSLDPPSPHKDLLDHISNLGRLCSKSYGGLIMVPNLRPRASHKMSVNRRLVPKSLFGVVLLLLAWIVMSSSQASVTHASQGPGVWFVESLPT